MSACCLIRGIYQVSMRFHSLVKGRRDGNVNVVNELKTRVCEFYFLLLCEARKHKSCSDVCSQEVFIAPGLFYLTEAIEIGCKYSSNVTNALIVRIKMIKFCDLVASTCTVCCGIKCTFLYCFGGDKRGPLALLSYVLPCPPCAGFLQCFFLD